MLIQAPTPLKWLLLGKETLRFLLSIMSIDRIWSISKRWCRTGTNAQEWGLRYFSHIWHNHKNHSKSEPVVDGNWHTAAKEPVPGFDSDCCLLRYYCFSPQVCFLRLEGSLLPRASVCNSHIRCKKMKHRQYSVSRLPSPQGIPSHQAFTMARQSSLMLLQLSKAQFTMDGLQLAWYFVYVTIVFRSDVASH